MQTQLAIGWKGDLIAISYLIAVQAAYTALNIVQLRFNRWLLALGALCLSVSGIWAMHFVGMAAMTIGTDVTYHLGWTIGSIFFSYIPTLAAFFLLDRFLSSSGRDPRDVSWDAHVEALLDAPHAVITVSALLIALGVCAMHYTGMEAMTLANTVKVMDWGVIVASGFIAMFAATAALYFAFVIPLTRQYTIPTALVAGIAVCGMHYTGMYGIRYEIRDPTLETNGSSSITSYALYIMFASMVLSSASLAFSSHLYKMNLVSAADDAKVFADKILAGRFDEMEDIQSEQQGQNGATESSSRDDPIMLRIKKSYEAMGGQLKRMRDFLPAALLAQFEEMYVEATAAAAATCKDAEETEDEGDLDQKTTNSATSKSSKARRESRFGTASTASGRMIPTTVVSTSNAFELGLHRRSVSVLCLNLHGFHSVPENAVASTYSALTLALQRVTKQHRGVVDSVHGDRALVSFNGSVRNATFAKSAVSASLDLAADLQRCCAIGVMAGEALVGNIGCSGMVRYSICGPVVSQAAELMAMCRAFHESQGVHVLTVPSGDMTMAALLRPVDVATVCGKRRVVCEVMPFAKKLDEDEWMYQLEKQESSDPYHLLRAAYALAADGKVAEAAAHAASLLSSTAATVSDVAADATTPSSRCSFAVESSKKLTLSVDRLKTVCQTAKS